MRYKFLLFFFYLGTGLTGIVSGQSTISKMKGISIMAPETAIDESWTGPIRELNAEWVALVPFGFSHADRPAVYYNLPDQFWGESMTGLEKMAGQAHEKGLKIMLKPQVFVPFSWPGGFELKSEKEWKKWEQNYLNFILPFAKMAEAENIELFCLSTEYKAAIQFRPEFWTRLIREVRAVYSGMLTYAANWDNYRKVPFWDQLDVIGVDAYFPLLEQATPEVKPLVAAWQAPVLALKNFSTAHGKQIMFTEFGYRSTNFTAWEQWEFEHRGTGEMVNLLAQDHAFQALFEAVWDQPWFAGGFIWKWRTNHEAIIGSQHSGYTPQSKPAQKTIIQWYSRSLPTD